VNKHLQHVLKFSLPAALLALAVPARATPVTVDQYIFQSGPGVNSSLLSGTVDISVSGSQITILLTNTSPDSAFTDGSFPALMLLTGVGLQLPGVNISGGTVSVYTGSTAVNFDSGQSTTDISNQWNYANSAEGGFSHSGVLAVDSMMSAISNGQSTRFAGAPPPSIGGPAYGAISALETQFGSSQAGVLDTIAIVITLDGAAPSVGTIDAGNVVLAFGSPGSGGRVPDNGSTILLLGLAITGLAAVAWRRGRKAA